MDGMICQEYTTHFACVFAFACVFSAWSMQFKQQISRARLDQCKDTLAQSLIRNSFPPTNIKTSIEIVMERTTAFTDSLPWAKVPMIRQMQSGELAKVSLTEGQVVRLIKSAQIKRLQIGQYAENLYHWTPLLEAIYCCA